MSLLGQHGLMLRRNADPYHGAVVSLHNFPGADGSTTAVDATGKTWATAGGFEIDNSPGYNVGLFNGTGRLASVSHVDWAMGTGDFTIEAWLRLAVVISDRSIFCVNGTGGVAMGITGGKVFCGPTGVSYGVQGTSTVPNTMTHVAASRVAGTTRIFVNGALEAAAADTYNYVQGAAMIGANQLPPAAPTGYFNGAMRAVRVTKGVGRYASAFTPPAPPLPY